jgi:hypothetical protein
MTGIAIELRTQCGGCGQPLPVNGYAEQVTCGGCHRQTRIDPDTWKSVLEDPVTEVHGMALDEGSRSTVMTGGQTFELLYGHQAPRCGSCKTTFPPESAQFVDRGWTVCVGCGQKAGLRRAPPPFVELGIQLLYGEDPAQLAGGSGPAPQVAKAASPVVLYCPQCKAPLSVDGSKRMVACQYCSTDVYLPDDLWTRLHPVKQVARWHGSFGSAAEREAHRRRRFEWYSLRDAVMAQDRQVFCVGTESSFDEPLLWCMGPDLQTKWFAKLAGFSDNDLRVALDPRGRLLVWQEHKSSVGVFSAADGSPLGKLGGREPEGAKVHHLDLERGKYLTVDVDGTLLALIGERLVRFAEDGTGVATWPPRSGFFGTKTEKLGPLYRAGRSLVEVEGPYVENVGHHPTALDDYTKLHVGWDGSLYAERSEFVAKFDRAGKRLWRVKLPVDSIRGDRFGSDGAGNFYALGTQGGDPRRRVLVRVSPDGERIDVLARDRRDGGVLCDEDTLMVAPDGTIVLMRWWMCIRVLGPDGRLLHASERSKEVEREEDEADAKRD